MAPDAPQQQAAPSSTTGSGSAPKKKNNKKKKSAAAKGKTNGDVVKAAEQRVQPEDATNKTKLEEGVEAEADDGDAEVEADAEESETPSSSVVNTPIVPKMLSTTKQEPGLNGHSTIEKTTANGTAKQEEPVPKAIDPVEDSIESNASDTTDASSRLEALSQDREALRAEVEKLRKALEDIQEKHTEEISTMRTELEESETARDQAQTQYQNLLGRVNTIKSTLGERLQADRQELAEANDRVEELEAQNQSLKASTENLEGQLSKVTTEAQETSKELSSLRNRHNLSQQNWLQEREDLTTQVQHLREEADAAKEAMGDWEVLAMEERSIREGLADRVAELEDQLSSQKEAFERAASERDSQSQAVDGLQRALQDIQEARKVELREMVETTQTQLDALNKLVQEAETRATEAEAAREALTKELERAAPFEKEVKEKNLLIGKLRHEAIILNDHLAKALRFLKKAKPEDNIDRQIVTNHFLHFLALDRSDPKKFQVLQLIAALLNWTDEQREQAGLSRPGAGTSSSSSAAAGSGAGSLRLPTSPLFHRTPSTPSLGSEFFPDGPGGYGQRETKESLGELWKAFLERQAEEGLSSPRSPGGQSRSASISSAAGLPPRPDTRG